MASGTLPDSLNERGKPVAGVRADHLFVLLECDRIAGLGSRHRLDQVDQVLLGRGDSRRAQRSGKRLTIEIPDPRMSAQHARLGRTPDGWRVEDAGSRNGLSIDGTKQSAAPLGDGALLCVGRTMLCVRESLPCPKDGALDFDASDSRPLAPGLATLIPELERELSVIAHLAPAKVPICIGGESGTGKELAARAVHALGGRPGAFVGVNCAAILASLLESELFGHKKGAFSGATEDRPGLIRAADGGTLFLDEIGDLPLPAQAALLRVLQERAVTPVGGTRPVPVDLALVSATHHDLDELVEKERFRADLLARLAGFRLELPSLRERREDLGLMIATLCANLGHPAATLVPETLLALLAYDWPLNVRELENALRSALALSAGAPLTREHLPAAVLKPRRMATLDDAALEAQLRALLTEHQGNVSRVARAWGRTRMQIHRWMRRFKIDPASFR